MTLPNCYRCGSSPCTCRDGCTLIHGDCLEVMAEMPSESVHTCVTSPPYWGLRDYGVDGQVGLEATPDAYVAKMVEVFREVRRVLRDDGTCWVNLGDSYAAVPKNRSLEQATASSTMQGGLGSQTSILTQQNKVVGNLKPKDLVGIPWRVAFALQADGWYLRQDIIWHKPNPMPESVTDRCTKAHEYIFLLSKSARYYWDADAIKTPLAPKTPSVHTTPIKGTGCESTGEKLNAWIGNNGGRYHPTAANKRSVWTVSSRPYAGAHFAVFPEQLIEPCILAGTSEEGCCPECGAPWVRVTAKERVPTRPGINTKYDATTWDKESMEVIPNRRDGNVIGNRDPQRHCTATKTTGWRPGCECLKQPSDVPILERSYTRGCVVLDPFLGSGTTAAVARKNGCRCVGIELNEEYLQLAANRLQQGVLF